MYARAFDPEEVWRTVEKYGVNVMQVTGDAMARPLADTLERLQGDVDVSSLLSFGSTAAIFSQTVKEQLQELLPEYLVMTDSVGSTETGHERHPLRAEGRRAEGGHHDACRRRPTPSCSTTTFEPVEPGSGKVGLLARGGNIPLGYYNDPGEDRGDVRHRRRGPALVDPRRLRAIEADGRITLLGRGSVSINSGGEKIYPEEVEGALKAHPDVFDVLVVGVPDERWGERVVARCCSRGRATTPVLEELREHCRTRIAGYKIPRQLLLVDEVPRLPNGKPDYRSAKETGEERAQNGPAKLGDGDGPRDT